MFATSKSIRQSGNFFLASALCSAAVAMFLVAVSFAAGAQAPKAAAADPLEVRLERKKVTLVDGKELMAPASTARPGDLIEETATYTNRSKKTFRVDATLPVPQYTELVTGSAAPASAMASADGRVFAAMPLKRQVKKANGVVTEELVALSDYKALRWNAINLAPEKQFVVSARFRLRENSTPQPK